MGARKQWTGAEKLQIVLRGLTGKATLAEICNENGITQRRSSSADESIKNGRNSRKRTEN